MRATAQNKDAAAMMGIDVNRTISFTFLVAGALAGAAGVIFTLYGTTIQFNTGFTLGLIAFTAAVLGGIGNLPGAVLGGLLIGFIQDYNEGLSWHAPGSAWTNSIVFGILILILVFRPQGLLGEQTPEGGVVARAQHGGRLYRGVLPPSRGSGSEGRAIALGEPVAVPAAGPPAARDRVDRDPRDAAVPVARSGSDRPARDRLRPLHPPRSHERRWALPATVLALAVALPAPHPAGELPTVPLRGSDLQHRSRASTRWP